MYQALCWALEFSRECEVLAQEFSVRTERPTTPIISHADMSQGILIKALSESVGHEEWREGARFRFGVREDLPMANGRISEN